MATSGSFQIKTGDANDNQVIMDFYWERTSYSVADGTSSILWTATGYVKSPSGSMGIRSNWIDTLIVNGTTIFTGKTAAFNEGGIFVVTHAGAGQSASFTVTTKMGWRVSSVGTVTGGSGVGSPVTTTCTTQALPQPAYLTAAAAFNDEGNPTFSYTSPTSTEIEKVEACIGKEDGTVLTTWTNVPKTSTSNQTITLSSSDRVALRRQITSGNSGQFKVLLRTTIDGISAFRSSYSVRMNLINYEPTLAPTVIDVDSRTTALTGNNKKFIKYFSNAQCDTGAAGKKEARIVSQYIICGSQTVDDVSNNRGTIEDIDSNTFYFGATDNRGYTVRDFAVVDLIPYTKLTAVLTPQPLSLSGDLTFVISGNYYRGSFGAKNNTLEFEYGLRKDGGDIKWYIISPTITYGDGTYEAVYSITGLDPNSTYEITANVIDELMSVQSQAESVISKPIFDWGKSDFKHNTPVYLTKNLSLRVIDNDYNDISVLNPCNPNGNLVIGWGQYDKANGDTQIYGNNVNLTAKENVQIQGVPVGGRVLWEGAYYMNASQVAKLSSPVSEQINGIVLVFSLYTDGFADDTSLHSFFISKKEVELLPGTPHTFFLMINAGFSVIGSKYIYINDNNLTGHATNTSTGTNSGITFANNRFVLRYVIGV